MKAFEQIPHTADIKIRVRGKTKAELYKHALIGMFQVVGPHASGCEQQSGLLVCPALPQTHEVEVHSVDSEGLMVDFLSEALWLSDVHNEAYLAADIKECTHTSIQATIKGVRVTGFDVVEIKAVTYHDLAIKKIDDYWQTDIVLDI